MSDAIIHSVVVDDCYRRVRAIVMLETPLPGDRSETDWRLPCVVILSNAAKVCPSILASIRLPLMLPKNCPAAWLVDFEPIACHVAAIVYSGTAEIDVVAVACAA